MNFLYAPWRSDYLENETTPLRKPNDCIFCTQIQENNDQKYFILKRTTHCVAMLNLFPYNSGHLLIVPLTHSDDLSKLLPEERENLMELISTSTNILRTQIKAEGINIGMNIGGKAAGGSIPEHLHAHVLPRFLGDTNFLPLLADTKHISLDLQKIYLNLKKSFDAL